MFRELKDATIQDITFENLTVKLNVNTGIRVDVGALALSAENVTLSNVRFDGLTIISGKGDDGAARYRLADLFLSQRNVKLTNVTADNIDIQASPAAQINSYFGFEIRVEEEPVVPEE